MPPQCGFANREGEVIVVNQVDSPNSAIGRARSTKRRWLFRVMLAAGVWLVCELISWIGLSVVEFGWRHVASERDGIGEIELKDGQFEKKEGRFDPAEDILHPYLGFVRRPRSVGENESPFGVSEFGFPDDEAPLIVRQPNEVVIAVLGGSLAEEFARHGWDDLREHLQASEAFRGKRPRIVRLGLSGYKQPQQLLLVNYLLALGAEFDVVVNVDGFNEITLPDVENVPNRVFAAFPRGWHVRVMDTDDHEVLRRVGHLVALQEADKAQAKFFGQAPWRWSPTACVVWLALHRRSETQQVQAHRDLQALGDRDVVHVALGPKQSFESNDALYRHCAALWQNSSRLLHATCQQRSIRYLHFLQPNQYLPGSKPLMGDEEKSIAYQARYPGRNGVEQGYPLLQQAGKELASEGVEFHDLTQLFHETAETTYRDQCCHLNNTGNAMLAKRIAEALIRRP